MTIKSGQRQKAPKEKKRISKTVFHDIRRGDFKRTLRRDLKELYHFYLDEEHRSKLAAMNRFKRWILIGFWLLKSMIFKLTPTRRILLVICFILFLLSRTTFTIGEVHFHPNFILYSFLLLLIILMLELKDKLLARDELMIGRAVQLSLLPDRNPTLPGWEIWMFTRPANDVGGDLVDYLQIGDNRLGLVIGDVAGKGLGAALLMAKLQATLRALAPDAKSISDLGARLNEILCRDGVENRFATLVYLEIEPHSGFIHLLNAGHIPPVTLEAGSFQDMSPVAPILGILPEAKFIEQKINLQPGSLLFIYSDGLTEARNEQGDFYGEKRLRKLLHQLQGLSCSEVGKRILNDVERFAGEEPQNDDLSIILLRCLH